MPKRATLLMSVLLIIFAAGCKKKPPIATAPPPPAPPTTTTTTTTETSRAAVVVQFTAEPTSIERGQSATLRWSVSDATSVSIEPGLGSVPNNGTRQVFPSNTTTYRLAAVSAAGNANATATVNVSVPQSAPPPPPPSATSLVSAIQGSVMDAYFDYDSSDIREDARNTLSRDSDALKRILQDFPSAVLMVEGHCDERGSGEYNLGLADRRATAAKEFLIQLGVPADRLKTISYGKERPQCQESNEACWQKNRRAHFAPGQ
jgi:peptidoglycan-associated lipoprotein